MPSLPIAHVRGGKLEEPRSLIDASEKPLLHPLKDKEWPTLSPQKITDTMRVISKDGQRYPLLSGTLDNAEAEQQTVEILSSANKVSTHPTIEPPQSSGIERKNPRSKALLASHRLSTGAVDKTASGQEVGFTDSDLPTEDLPDFHVGSPNTLNNSFAKPDPVFIRGNRPPTQFVAGSRRIIRGSHHNESSPKFQPSRPVPAIPKVDPSTRRSSIPVSKASTSEGSSILTP